MQVTAEGIQARLGNNGLVLYVADNSGRHVGKLRIGQATVEWCAGRTRVGNGRKISLKDFIENHLDRM